MRVAVMVVVMFAVTTPVQASQSCMNKSEARQHFSTSHLYWHGPNHCWDATAGRHHGIHGVRRSTSSRHAERKHDRPEPDRSQLDDQSKSERSKWRDSMSAMLPDADQPLRAAREARSDAADSAAVGALAPSDRDVEAAASPVVSRWVDIAQVVPRPPVIEARPEPSGMPGSIVLVLIAIVVTMGIVVILFRVTPRPESAMDL
jgi:hypothetical protein